MSDRPRGQREREERQLLRLIHGELAAEEADELRRRLARQPRLARRYRRLEALWHGLELPTAPAPPGFTARVAARVREEGRDGVSWTAAPGWVRLVGAVTLAGGLLLGAVLPGALAGRATSLTPEAVVPETGPTLSEAYWRAVEELEGRSGDEEVPL